MVALHCCCCNVYPKSRTGKEKARLSKAVLLLLPVMMMAGVMVRKEANDGAPGSTTEEKKREEKGDRISANCRFIDVKSLPRGYQRGKGQDYQMKCKATMR